MNRERFHNELAMRLGYERIVNNKRIMITVEDSDDPIVTVKVQGNDDIRFKASGKTENNVYMAQPEMHKVLTEIADAVHQAYINANTSIF